MRQNCFAQMEANARLDMQGGRGKEVTFVGYVGAQATIPQIPLDAQKKDCARHWKSLVAIHLCV
jgi:hypothetical protein